MLCCIALAVLGLLLVCPAGGAVVSGAAQEDADRLGEASVVVRLRAPAPGAAPERGALMSRRRAAVLAAIADGVEVTHAYQTVPGFAARVTRAALDELRRNPDVERIDLDGLGTAALGGSVPQVRAERVHARSVDGRGSVIAIVDNGIDAAHPDIADALVHEECFCRGGISGGLSRNPCCPNGEARASGPGSAATTDPHGPHVAGIALSRGRVAPVGMAPGAELLAVRVLDDRNRGFLSDWIAALDWIAAERSDVRVVNMSLVSQGQYSPGCERNCGDQEGCATNQLFADAIEQLWQRGAMLFAATGNNGRANAVNAPACVSRAVAVGAVNDVDMIASFTNKGGMDLLAPGVDIISDGLGGGLFMQSGTSMAAPHAAGAAALLLSARPGLRAEQVVALLGESGTPVLDPRSGRTTPRVDAFAALGAAMRAPELVRGGGGRRSDCLLEFSVLPPEAVDARAYSSATCTDNDPLCDGDSTPGICTFGVSVCLNMRDPLLADCAVPEPLEQLAMIAPRLDAPPGTVERTNAEALAFAVPAFPFAGANACSSPVPFVVERPPGGGPGRGEIRMRVSGATRADYDRLRFECNPP